MEHYSVLSFKTHSYSLRHNPARQDNNYSLLGHEMADVCLGIQNETRSLTCPELACFLVIHHPQEDPTFCTPALSFPRSQRGGDFFIWKDPLIFSTIIREKAKNRDKTKGDPHESRKPF
jgi:hypothetical protein